MGFVLMLQYKTVYKKMVHTRNVTVTLNLTDSLNITESNLTVNFGTVLHTVQVNRHYSDPAVFADTINQVMVFHLTGDGGRNRSCVWFLWWSERSGSGGLLHVLWSGYW